jgi:hypothetical protein
VQRERGGAGVDEPRPELEAGACAVLEAAAHLHRDRELDGGRDGLDDARGAAGILEQGRARAGLRDLAHRAAEVDVHDVRAGVGDHPRRLGHHGRIGAEDLHGQRVLVAGDAEIAKRALVSVVQPGATDHLGANQPRTEAPALAAEGLHAHARHRGEHEPGRNLHRPDPPGGAEIDVHGRPMIAGLAGLLRSLTPFGATATMPPATAHLCASHFF